MEIEPVRRQLGDVALATQHLQQKAPPRRQNSSSRNLGLRKTSRLSPCPGPPASLVLSAALVLALLASPASAVPTDSTPASTSASTDQRADQSQRRASTPARRAVTYSVISRGHVTASMKVFRRQAQETYDDQRGWRAGGIEFRRVRRGGDFTLVLASARAVPTFSASCSAQWSCRVGRFVIINQLRWKHASPAWNAAGRSTRDYRHLVVNHETGHWLGLGHASCPRRGSKAPVMMQQSKRTDGCRLNPWPLPPEAARVR